MKLTHSETAHICRGLALLLHAGISLNDGIFLLAQEETGPRKRLLEAIGAAMDSGFPLSQAMEQTGNFPSHVPGMAAIGEATGRMEEALSSLADYYEERERTARQIRNALAYPCMILLLMLGVVGVLLVKVLPVFDQVYASLGSRLTGIAGGLLRLGQGLEAALPVFLALLVLSAVLVLLYARWTPFREAVSRRFQTWFGDRGISRKFNNARFARALAMGLGSGLSLEEALSLAESLLEDIPHAARRCKDCTGEIASGEGLDRAMAKTGLLPPAQTRMLSVGLRSGSTDRIMEDIALRLMEDAEESLENTISKVEPAMVMACSLLVGAILLAVMLPLMGILSTIG